jgi:hypothetical protein
MTWLRTLLFALLVPGTVLGAIPYLLTRDGWGGGVELGAARYLGVLLMLPASC